VNRQRCRSDSQSIDGGVVVSKEVLDFVLEMVQAQLKADNRASVVEVAKSLFEIIPASQTQTVQERKGVESVAASERRAADHMESIQSIVAPEPVIEVPDGEDYDHLNATMALPKFERLPDEFGISHASVSAVKLNEQTVAMSYIHYCDLLAIRDECKRLRESNARLESGMLESARRHVALETLSTGTITIHKSDGNFVVITENCTARDGSLTVCLEKAVASSGIVSRSVEAVAAAESAEVESVEYLMGRPVHESTELDAVDMSGVTIEPVTQGHAVSVLNVATQVSGDVYPDLVGADIGSKWLTRCGEIAEITSRYEITNYPLCGKIDGREYSWRLSGREFGQTDSANDLISRLPDSVQEATPEEGPPPQVDEQPF